MTTWPGTKETTDKRPDPGLYHDGSRCFVTYGCSLGGGFHTSQRDTAAFYMGVCRIIWHEMGPIGYTSVIWAVPIYNRHILDFGKHSFSLSTACSADCGLYDIFQPPGPGEVHVVYNKIHGGDSGCCAGGDGSHISVPFIHHWIGGTGSSILTASLTLTMMVMPTLCLGCRSAVLSVPWKYYQGARALGISHEKTVFLLMVPQAWRGILTAVLFSTGRIMGETLIVVMTAGNQAWMPDSWLDGVRTLTANIFLEMSYAPGDGGDPVLAAAAVLLIFIFAVQLLFSVMRRRCFPYGK